MLQQFRQMNTIARPGGIVFFGSTFFSQLPFAELAQDFGTELPVYNRSIAGLTIREALEVLEPCVLDLRPRRIFVNMGDAELDDGTITPDAFAEAYQWLLYRLHNACGAKIYTLSILSDSPEADKYNMRLQQLADETGCTYLDVREALLCDSPAQHLFTLLHRFMRTWPIGFAEAMSLHR